MADFPSPRTIRTLYAAGTVALALSIAPLSARAAVDPVNDLASAICAAPDVNAITAILASLPREFEMAPEDVAEAFGVATFLGGLQRCADRQAVIDGFAYYKKGKDGAKLDAAFAMGRVSAKPDGRDDQDRERESGNDSFDDIGEAGEPPSGH